MDRFLSMAGFAGRGQSNGAPVPNGHSVANGHIPRQRRAQAAPDRSEARLRAMLDASPDCVVVVRREAGIVEEINPSGLEMFEAREMEEMIGKPLAAFVAAEQREAFDLCTDALWRGEKGYAEFESTGCKGGRRWIEMHAAPLRGADGEVQSFLGILRDNTARRNLDKQFIQAQKMEVVGQLAGGVAHDFNNILGIVMGYTEIIMDGMEAGPRRDQAQIVFNTAERGAALTRQLLIFSSKQTPRPQVVDLSEVVANIDRMLRRLIGEHINLVTLPEPELGRIEADLCQIEQVLMNLTVNARDAMALGGTITIETTNAVVSRADETALGVPSGRYVLVSVSDTGAGMSEEVKSRIFEAFFTTKPLGKGTGLGLATCQNIVRQWNGHISVESRLGAGSTFRVYFPCLPPAAAKKDKGTAQAGEAPRGAETVLLVEDDRGLLELTATVLQRQGYTVLKATNGREALGMVHEGNAGAIDLVVTDMVMPEMGGRLMADWLYSMNPELKILFTSGYTDLGNGGLIEAGVDFIHKPYTPSVMLRKIREIIDRGGASAAQSTNGADA